MTAAGGRMGTALNLVIERPISTVAGEVLGPAVQATIAQLSMIAPAASAARAVVVDQHPCSEDLLLIGFTALFPPTASGAKFKNVGLRLFNESRRSSSNASIPETVTNASGPGPRREILKDAGGHSTTRNFLNVTR